MVTMKSEERTKEWIEDLEEQLRYIEVLELELDQAELEGRGCEVGSTKRLLLTERKLEIDVELSLLRGN